MQVQKYDTVIVGGGFFGIVLAIHLKKKGFENSVLVIEKEPRILERASKNNQARVHNGYHYPRSFATAVRSRVNYPKFIDKWTAAVDQNVTGIYAIARGGSKVNARQFLNFCKATGARIEPARPSFKAFFNNNRIEAVFEIEECVFDSNRLRCLLADEANELGVEIQCDTKAEEIQNIGQSGQDLLISRNGEQVAYRAGKIFNCSYSGLNQIRNAPISNYKLKHELAEIALVTPPSCLKDIAITVMDGPFFSLMPYPSEQLHSLSHVRYTPHLSWNDNAGDDPYKRLEGKARYSRFEYMIRDARRFMPILDEARVSSSFFEIKTILLNNEVDDGRPMVFEQYKAAPKFYSILGAKLDNIFDILERVDNLYHNNNF